MATGASTASTAGATQKNSGTQICQPTCGWRAASWCCRRRMMRGRWRRSRRASRSRRPACGPSSAWPSCLTHSSLQCVGGVCGGCVGPGVVGQAMRRGWGWGGDEGDPAAVANKPATFRCAARLLACTSPIVPLLPPQVRIEARIKVPRGGWCACGGQRQAPVAAGAEARCDAPGPSGLFSTRPCPCPPTAGLGTWPAFWLLADDGAYAACSGCGRYGEWASSGEIDIMETANNASRVQGARGAAGLAAMWLYVCLLCLLVAAPAAASAAPSPHTCRHASLWRPQARKHLHHCRHVADQPRLVRRQLAHLPPGLDPQAGTCGWREPL